MLRLELFEKYFAEGEYSQEWWLENMPEGTTPPSSHSYRRTSVAFEDIERITEIPGNEEECIVRFYSTEEMIIKENFDTFCIFFNDLVNAYYEDGDE